MGTLNTSWGHRLRGMLAALLMIGATVVVILLLTSQHSSAQQARQQKAQAQSKNGGPLGASDARQRTSIPEQHQPVSRVLLSCAGRDERGGGILPVAQSSPDGQSGPVAGRGRDLYRLLRADGL